MHPILTFDIPGLGPFQIFSYATSVAVAVLVAIVIFITALRQSEGVLRPFFVAAATSFVTFMGARLLHVLWERPGYYMDHPKEVFSRFDGMVLYGGFIAGSAAFFFLIRYVFKAPNRPRAWDLAAIGAATTVAIIRVGCFANGCCWGKVTRVPWAVRYFDTNAVIPYFGIPVHPVQLYESFSAFLLAGFLAYLYRYQKQFQGLLISIFCIIYGSLRFVLEFYRGDTFRGVDLLLGMSTSQIISVVIILIGVAQIRMSRKFTTACFSFLALLGISGCLPQSPGPSVVVKKEMFSPTIELNQMNKQHFIISAEPPRKAVVVSTPSRRNLLFVAADDEVQMRFEEPLKQAYQSEEAIRLEELSWWLYAPETRLLYDQVLRIPFDKLNKETLFSAIFQLEAQGLPYDVVLLTHGLPNNIVPSKGSKLISYKDLAELKGKLQHIHLVFYQGCFGNSLTKDWLATGAKAILSYSGLNRNFFYLGFFLKNYYRWPQDVARAHAQTNREIADKIRGSILYKKIIQTMGMSMEEYLSISPSPTLTNAPSQDQ